MEKIQIQFVDINSLKPNPMNPRINDKAVDSVVKSIKKNGWTQPLVCDQDFVLAVGHVRLKAAHKLALTQVPVIVKKMTPAERDAYLIADNKVGEISSWDNNLLAELMGQLSEKDKSLLEFTGYSEEEIDELLGTEEIDEMLEDEGLQDDSAQTTEKSGASHVRMVQLFLNDVTFPKFVTMVEGIQEKLGCSNMTDTVYSAVEHIFDEDNRRK